MSTSIIFLALIILVCFLLVIVVMVQDPKGTGIGSSFGGSSGGGQLGGVKQTNDFLEKSTWTLATVLLVLILLYNVSVSGGSTTAESRLMDGATPTTTAPAATPQSTNQDNTQSVLPGSNTDQQNQTGTKEGADN